MKSTYIFCSLSVTVSCSRPSLADKLRVGYFSMDRACQTEESDIIDLKETTALLSTLVQVNLCHQLAPLINFLFKQAI